MNIREIHYIDTDYCICECEEGLIVHYHFENETPPYWVEHQMKLMVWHLFDKKATFGEPDELDGYWYIPVKLTTEKVKHPVYKYNGVR